jgi:hypothetical protein
MVRGRTWLFIASSCTQYSVLFSSFPPPIHLVIWGTVRTLADLVYPWTSIPLYSLRTGSRRRSSGPSNRDTYWSLISLLADEHQMSNVQSAAHRQMHKNAKVPELSNRTELVRCRCAKLPQLCPTSCLLSKAPSRVLTHIPRIIDSGSRRLRAAYRWFGWGVTVDVQESNYLTFIRPNYVFRGIILTKIP